MTQKLEKKKLNELLSQAKTSRRKKSKKNAKKSKPQKPKPKTLKIDLLSYTLKLGLNPKPNISF
jgi:hypothetical protein